VDFVRADAMAPEADDASADAGADDDAGTSPADGSLAEAASE